MQLMQSPLITKKKSGCILPHTGVNHRTITESVLFVSLHETQLTCSLQFPGIENEGIFRVNGNSRIVEKLKDSFDRYGDADLESADDIMSAAGLLKLFLRELPESAIPEEMTRDFVTCQESELAMVTANVIFLAAVLPISPLCACL